MSDPAPNTSMLADFNFQYRNATLPLTGSLVASSYSHHSVLYTIAIGVNEFVIVILTNTSPLLLYLSSVDVAGVHKVMVSLSSY